MSATARAALAAAYSSGLRPRFVNVLPGGWDEAWAIGDLMLVIPVVPANAPAALQYALRLRRECMIEGRCPNCDAVPAVDTLGQPEGIPLAAAAFNHKSRCPARDSNVAKLRSAYFEKMHGSDTDELLESANAVARARISDLGSTGGVPMLAPESESIALKFLDSLTPPQNAQPSCDHLVVDPFQTWNVLIADGRWRCDQCNAYFHQSVQEGFNLGELEEFTCDVCRRYTPMTLGPMVLRVGIFVMTGGVCGRCAARYQAGEV